MSSKPENLRRIRLVFFSVLGLGSFLKEGKMWRKAMEREQS
jgi:hypothetical protein